MKKLISLLTIAVLVAALTIAAFATGEPTLVINDVEAAPGELVTVNVTIANNPGFSIGEMTISYDKDALELQPVNPEKEEKDWEYCTFSNGFMGALNPETGFVTFAAMNDLTDENATVFSVIFKVSENAKPGKYPVTVYVDYIENLDGAIISDAEFTGYVVIPCNGNHVWDEGTVKTPATCTEEGVMVYTCTACGETKEEAIAAEGHAWGEWTVTTAAICGVDGEETRICDNCNETENRVIAALEHKWVETERVDATCFEDGKIVYTCENCGETKEEVIEAADAHTWNDGEVKTAATCCTDGVMVYTCTACGETKEEAIAANGEHTWNEGEVKTAATCCTDGVMLYTCVNGTATKEETIAATGEHDLAYEAIDDVNHKVICKTSGKELSTEAHTFGDLIDDVENPGWKYQLCEKCQYKLLDEPDETGDNSMIAVAMATLSILGIAVVVSKKKEF